MGIKNMKELTLLDIRSKIAVKIDEAAVLLSMSKRTLERHLSLRTGPVPFRRRPLTFSISELERWSESQQSKIYNNMEPTKQ